MAAFEVQVTSKDMIKPTRPTPSHLKTHRLSFLDQLVASVHMPTVLYYQKPSSQLDTTTLLKTSLSETLVSFYPLAGRINQGDGCIDCNDEGVEFYEARVPTKLSAVIEDPNPDDLTKLLPSGINHPMVPTAVQVNQFSCGGVAISLCISHKIADASTIAAFLNAWGANARGVSVTTQPKFTSPSLFPPRDLSKWFQNRSETLLSSTENKVTRRLVFDKEQIHTLKKQAAIGGGFGSLQVKSTPSRAVLVSAYIWKRFIEAGRAQQHPPKLFGARQVVNLRTVPLLSSLAHHQNCLGNMYTYTAIASYDLKEQEEAGDHDVYAQLIAKLQKSNKDVVDLKFFERLQNGENLRPLPREYTENRAPGDVEVYSFSSCIWFPYYDVNFGWGKPEWVSMASLPHKNATILFPTKCGEGIEAWVSMDRDCVSVFEKELLLPKQPFTIRPLSRL